jgi:hypothetical protein
MNARLLSNPFLPMAITLGLFAAPLVIVSLACNRLSQAPAPETSAEMEMASIEGDTALREPSDATNDVAMAAESAGSMAPVAVVELFTSEGCSSCPPADRHLARLAASAEERGARVYPLSFHVDYWDYLGWKDPFSSEEYSARQRNYAGLWNSRRVYTPQMIVNGKTEFVGSDARQAEQAIKVALEAQAKAAVSLKTSSNGGRSLKIDYSVQSNLKDLRLNLAAVQRKGEKVVKSGENAGHTLAHRNIVRRFKTLKLAQNSGSWETELPPDLAPREALVVAYLQQADGAIVGAGAAAAQ